ncbi:MAG: 2-hydroxychromene-2-carboxylate isomerase, partial [Gammaproteobacteria bacterium]|nr:2-hydroxychromene-2-carboxylate isomerase [Gammaproteobacteria bacterium]
MHRVEFFFDCSSPWTYLAFESIQPIAAREDVTMTWCPILVGGVFNAVNSSVYDNRANPVPAKAQYYRKDLQDWARYVGITIGQPSVFPVNSVKAMRGAFVAMEHDCLIAYARRVFHRYWSELEDISQDAVLASIASACGIDPTEYFDKIASTPYKDRLRHSTQALISRGGFGSPT